MNDQMTLAAGIALAALAGLVISWLVWIGVRRHQARSLRDRFGPEYAAAHEQYGKKADLKLRERVQRGGQLSLRPLTLEERERFETAWHTAQARFIDDPLVSVVEANRLVKDVLMCCGYPVTDFDHRIADISVEHPRVVHDYRAAHSISQRGREGRATTEE